MRMALDRPMRPAWGVHEHHIFNGSCRKWSEKYNCVIYISPAAHEYIHKNADCRKALKAEYQQKLELAGWTRSEFVETFGKNYL